MAKRYAVNLEELCNEAADYYDSNLVERLVDRMLDYSALDPIKQLEHRLVHDYHLQNTHFGYFRKEFGQGDNSHVQYLFSAKNPIANMPGTYLMEVPFKVAADMDEELYNLHRSQTLAHRWAQVEIYGGGLGILAGLAAIMGSISHRRPVVPRDLYLTFGLAAVGTVWGLLSADNNRRNAVAAIEHIKELEYDMTAKSHQPYDYRVINKIAF